MATTKFLSKEGLERVLQNLSAKFAAFVPVTRKINGKMLTSDITIDAGVTMEEVDEAIRAAIIESWMSGI